MLTLILYIAAGFTWNSNQRNICFMKNLFMCDMLSLELGHKYKNKTKEIKKYD